MKIVGYTVISDESVDDLTIRVSNLIVDGWQPFQPLVIEYEETFDSLDGGPKMAAYYHQAMVQYE